MGTGCLFCNMSDTNFPLINEYLFVWVVVRQNGPHLYVGMNIVEQNRYALKVNSRILTVGHSYSRIVCLFFYIFPRRNHKARTCIFKKVQSPFPFISIIARQREMLNDVHLLEIL